MVAGQTSVLPHHTCSCGETFDTTDDLLDHGREDHGLPVF